MTVTKTFFSLVFIAFAVYFLSWIFVYKTGVNKLAIQSEDTLPAMFVPVSIIKEHTLYANTYYEMIRQKYPHPDDKNNSLKLTPFYFKKINSNYISAFTLIPGLMALPIYFLPVIFGMPITFDSLTILAKVTAALTIAFAGGFFYLLLYNYYFKESTKRQFYSILLSIVFLFATINYALLSQSLWQHGFLELFVVLALLFANRFFDTAKKLDLFLSGFFMGVAILARPTAILIFLALFILVLRRTPPRLTTIVGHSLSYIGGLIPAVLFFIWYNATYYLDVSNQGYAAQLGTQWLSRFPEGFLGVWLSPSKGILIYSPVFIFAFLGAYMAIKNLKGHNKFTYVVYFCLVMLHTLIISKWKHWYGGWSFGYRMSADILPFLVLLLVPYLTAFAHRRVFYSLLVFSILVQLYGMVFFDGIWHAAYDKGFVNTSWLWSLENSEVAFNIRRTFVKLGVLDKACDICSTN